MTDALTTDELDDKSVCSEPCCEDLGCVECAAYWNRMVAEGHWSMEQHKWTDKGWAEMTMF